MERCAQLGPGLLKWDFGVTGCLVSHHIAQYASTVSEVAAGPPAFAQPAAAAAGAADQPVGQKMVGADMVISRIVDGQPSVLDYHAIGHVPPILDTDDGGKNDVTLISYQRSGGTTVSVFERPLVASDSNGLDNPVLLDGPNTFIVSHGQDDSLNYHG